MRRDENIGILKSVWKKEGCVAHPVLSDPGELRAEGGELRVHVRPDIRAPAGLQLECSGVDNHARELDDLLRCVRGVRGVRASALMCSFIHVLVDHLALSICSSEVVIVYLLITYCSFI